jgi:hypothetical protein
MLAAVFLTCRSITLDNRYSTVDVYYLQPLCEGWLSVFSLCNVAAMLMPILLPNFAFKAVSAPVKKLLFVLSVLLFNVVSLFIVVIALLIVLVCLFVLFSLLLIQVDVLLFNVVGLFILMIALSIVLVCLFIEVKSLFVEMNILLWV